MVPTNNAVTAASPAKTINAKTGGSFFPYGNGRTGCDGGSGEGCGGGNGGGDGIT